MAVWIPSPNYSSGRAGKRIDRIVCHWIVGTLATADAVFKNAANQVSAHYGVGNNEVHQYVRETDTAWHAGNFDVNQRSIGIEHQGGPSLPISDATYETSANLIADIWRRYGQLPLVPHRSIVATQCPGNLDLSRLASRASQLVNNSGGTGSMDANDGHELYRTGLFRNAESTAVASQWNGLKPEEAMRRLRAGAEWKQKAAMLAEYPTLKAQIAAKDAEIAALKASGSSNAKAEALKKALTEFLT